MGMVLLAEPASAARLLSLALILAGIIGLKLSSPESCRFAGAHIMIRRRLLASIAGTLLLARLGVAAGEARASTAPPGGTRSTRLRGCARSNTLPGGGSGYASSTPPAKGIRLPRGRALHDAQLLQVAGMRAGAAQGGLRHGIAGTQHRLFEAGSSALVAAHGEARGWGWHDPGALCEATITTSDNAAANLILASYGGPAALTAFVRRLGDETTRLDRIEPELNVPHSDSERDTTSPRAMVRSMARVLLGDALSAPRASNCSNGCWTAPPAPSVSAPACLATGRWATRPGPTRPTPTTSR